MCRLFQQTTNHNQSNLQRRSQWLERFEGFRLTAAINDVKTFFRHILDFWCHSYTTLISCTWCVSLKARTMCKINHFFAQPLPSLRAG